MPFWPHEHQVRLSTRAACTGLLKLRNNLILRLVALSQADMLDNWSSISIWAVSWRKLLPDLGPALWASGRYGFELWTALNTPKLVQSCSKQRRWGSAKGQGFTTQVFDVKSFGSKWPLSTSMQWLQHIQYKAALEVEKQYRELPMTQWGPSFVFCRVR
jgi:hypothetical protein